MVGFEVTIHQKALAVFGDVIAENVGAGNWSATVNLEKSGWGSGDEGARAVDRHCHQHATGTDIENLSAVSTPPRLGAAAARHLPFPSSARERGHVDLPIAGLIGGVGHPFSIGRNLSIRLTALTGEKPGGLSAGNGH